jgi:hypothetical protein
VETVDAKESDVLVLSAILIAKDGHDRSGDDEESIPKHHCSSAFATNVEKDINCCIIGNENLHQARLDSGVCLSIYILENLDIEASAT